jgi:cytochrome c oxidase subunit I+III
MVALAAASGVLAVAMIIAWMWRSDPAPLGPARIGDGIALPTYAAGPLSTSWWAMVVLLLVAGSLYLSFFFSYLYLWTVSPQIWPQPERLAPATWPALSAGLLVLSSGLIVLAGRTLRGGTLGRAGFVALTTLAVAALAGALMVEVGAEWRAGVRPDADAHGAMVFVAAVLQLQLVLALVAMAGFAVARRITRRLDAERRVVFDNLSLLWHYAVGQGLFGLLLVHGFPRIAA